MTGDRPDRHRMARETGKALLIYHLLAWVFMALNPWALPSGWLDIAMAPAFSLLFAFFVMILPFDPVSLAARLTAFGLLIAAVRMRRHPRLWWIILAALVALGIAGLRVALTVARM